ncbi:MAG: SseB family protein [Deltaproteobacteria bacterium]|nr:SseB family protein [Deltaproteobacteria bacterium]
MSDEYSELTDKLSDIIDDAIRGDRESLRSFYNLIRNERFFVPTRYQNHALTHSPSYPNDFVNILGIQDEQRVIVPFFSKSTFIEEWFREELEFIELSGAELLDKIPQDWWACINPNLDTHKEFSPWEIEKLRGNEQDVDEAILDLLPNELSNIELSKIESDEYPEIKTKLLDFAQNHPEIEELYLLKEQGVDESGYKQTTLLLGTKTKNEPSIKLKTSLDDFTRQISIGDDRIRTLFDRTLDSISLGIFKQSNPIYKKSRIKVALATLPNIVMLVLFLSYLFFYWNDLKEFWFNPSWTTDDALQQVYPFHSVYHPDIFKGDIITETMLGYLAPLHYWCGYAITYLTADPIMTAHWMTLIQLALTLIFIFLAVRHSANLSAALFAMTWFLHTRPVVQRITGGLPRGWAAPILAAFIYFSLKNSHLAILLTLLCGCLLHPPVTLIAALAYGLYLLWNCYRQRSSESKKLLFRYIALSPIYLLVTYYVIDRPDYIGEMVTRAQAAAMPEFQWPDGRFPFLPLKSVSYEFMKYGFQPFMSRLYEPGLIWDYALPFLCIASLIFFALKSFKGNKQIIPNQLWVLLCSILVVYFLSRALAFKLYVPNRHLQFPLAIFWITAFSIGFTKLFSEQKKQFYAFLGLAALIFIGSNTGLVGDGNFNYWETKKGKAFIWVRKFTNENSLIAGHPTHINGLQLFGMRKAYVTTEVAHPFYPKYYSEMKRRLEISVKAHYAQNLDQFLKLLIPEGIDYFIFSRKRFYPEALKEDKLFSPLNTLVTELTSRDYHNYFYKSLPTEVNLEKNPFLVYRDDESAIVDVKALAKTKSEL